MCSRGVATLEARLKLLVNLCEGGGSRIERLVFNHPQSRQQGIVLSGIGAHAHEYSSAGTSSA